jgi:electron transfer flavoprotein alpha subunit
MPRILVVAEQRDGKLNHASLETVAAAQAIGRETSWPVEVLLPGYKILKAAQGLLSPDVAKVYSLEGSALEQYTSDAYVYALKDFLSSHPFQLVLLPHTYQVRDFAPSLAFALGRALISDAIGYKHEQGKLLFVRQVFQGKFLADVAFTSEAPWLATVQIGSFRAMRLEGGSVPEIKQTVERIQAAEGAPSRVTPHPVMERAKRTVNLADAGVIVAVGRGIREQKNIAIAEELAHVLGGEIAASRPICDNGWLPFDRQIGSSGQTVAPKLYLAIGISGAAQHLVGMKGSQTIVAINHDPEAPIFEIADYGVVGNLFDIVPRLVEEVKKAKGPG